MEKYYSYVAFIRNGSWSALTPEALGEPDLFLVSPKGNNIYWDGEYWTSSEVYFLGGRPFCPETSIYDAKIASRLILESHMHGFAQIPSYLVWAVDKALLANIYPPETLESVLWWVLSNGGQSLKEHNGYIRKTLSVIFLKTFYLNKFSSSLLMSLVPIVKETLPSERVANSLERELRFDLQTEEIIERLMLFAREYHKAGCSDTLKLSYPSFQPLSYPAFKGLLVGEGGRLVSPHAKKEWLGNPPVMFRDDPKHGVFAATWRVASGYGDNICLVIPYFHGDTRARANVGTQGWEADGATIVAGPWNPRDIDGMRFCALLILESFRAGFPQVPRILFWACLAEIVFNPFFDEHLIKVALEHAISVERGLVAS